MLAADYSIKCFDGLWTGISFFAGIIVVFFSIGIPFALFYYLYKRKGLLYFTINEEAVLEADKVIAEYEGKDEDKGKGVDKGDGEGKTDSAEPNNESRDSVTKMLSETNKKLGIIYEQISNLLPGTEHIAKSTRLYQEIIQLLQTASTATDNEEQENADKDRDAKKYAAAKKVIARLGHLRPKEERQMSVNETRATLGILYQTYRREMYVLYLYIITAVRSLLPSLIYIFVYVSIPVSLICFTTSLASQVLLRVSSVDL